MTNTTTTSAYGAAKILNEILTSNNLPPVPPQMIYNYIRNNLLTAYTVNDKKVLSTVPSDNPKDFVNWMVRYLTKKGVVLTETDTENTIPLF